MSDEEFSKATMMQILRAKIALKFYSTEESNFGLINEYSPTLNRKNEAMVGVEEIFCEHIENLIVNDHIDLGEEYFLKLDDGGSKIDWSLGYNINPNYNWVKKLKFQLKYFLDDNKKLLLIEEHLYNPENTITDSQNNIIFNHIYQHYTFHIVKDIDDCPVSMNIKIQGLPDTSKIFITTTIRNININLNPMF